MSRGHKEKTQKIEELQQRLFALREQSDRLNAEAKGWAGKRNNLNEQVRDLRVEICDLENERDELNEKVKKLKLLRENTITGIRERIEETKKLGQQVKALTKKKPSKSMQTLQKKLEELEWEIQTTSLSLPEEKELVDEVRELAIQIDIHKRLGTLHRKMLELQTELKAIETKNRSYHKKLTETAQKSQKIHNKMLEKINRARELKMEADSMHQNFLKTRQKATPIQEEMSRVLNQMKVLRKTIRVEEVKEKKKSEKALRNKIEKQAKEKLKRGEKLTWQEFQIVTEKGKITQD